MALRYCNACGSPSVARDYLYGYLVCQACGAVVDDQPLDEGGPAALAEAGAPRPRAEDRLADAAAIARAALRAGFDVERAVRVAAAAARVRPGKIRRIVLGYRG